MAKNIEVIGNYVVVDSEVGALEVFPFTSIYSESTHEFIVRVDSRSEIFTIPFSEVGDWFTSAAGTTAFTIEALRTLFQSNTGM